MALFNRVDDQTVTTTAINFYGQLLQNLLRYSGWPRNTFWDVFGERWVNYQQRELVMPAWVICRRAGAVHYGTVVPGMAQLRSLFSMIEDKLAPRITILPEYVIAHEIDHQ